MSVDLFSSNVGLADPEGVSAEDISAAKAAFDAKTAPTAPAASGPRVNVIDPEDGKTYSLPASQVANAVKSGYKVETPEQTAVREFVEENKGIGGATKVALDKWADWASFGISDAIIDSQLNDLDKAKYQALYKSHKVAAALGAAAGFGTSLFYGGELFDTAGTAGSAVERGVLGVGEDVAGEALAAQIAEHAPGVAAEAVSKAAPGLARKLVAAGAGHAVEGAILSAPKALTEAALGDPAKAAETVMWGAGAGALFGLVGKGASEVFGGSNKVKSIVTDYADTATGIGGEASAPKSISEKLRDFSDKEVIKSFNPLKKYSKKIDGIGESEVAAVARKYNLMPEFGESAEAIAEKVAAKKSEVGAQIGDIVEKASGASPRVSSGEVASTLEKIAEGYDKGIKAVGGKPIASKLRSMADDIVNAFPSDMTLADIDGVRQYLGKNIPEGEKSAGLREALGDAYHKLNDAFFEKAEEAIKKSGGDVGVLSELKTLKSDYRALIPLAGATEDNISRGLSNRGHSLTDYLGNMIGGMVGHSIPIPGAGVAGAFLGGQVNKLGRKYGNAYLSKGADALANVLEGKGLGLVGIERVMKSTAEELDKLPQIIEGAAIEKATKESSDHFVSNPMSMAAFSKVSKQLTELASDPTSIKQNLEKLTGPIANDAPTVAAHLAGQTTAMVQYLFSAMPKPPAATGSNPFSNLPPWKPSDQALQEFHTIFNTVVQPKSLLESLRNGTLTKLQMDTARKFYPNTVDAIGDKVVQMAAEGKAKPLPYHRQVQLSLLTGQPLGDVLKDVSVFQGTFTGKPAGPQGPGGPPSGAGHRRAPGVSKNATMHLPSLGTETQRLQNKT